jgi:uncharacterized protein with HEPN domain
MAAKRRLTEADEQAFRDMLRFARDAAGLGRHATRGQFDSRLELRLALERLVELVGEAAKRVSSETRESQAQIEWSEIIKMRDKLAHNYERIDPEVVWNTVRKNLPPLIRQLETVLNRRHP